MGDGGKQREGSVVGGEEVDAGEVTAEGDDDGQWQSLVAEMEMLLRGRWTNRSMEGEQKTFQ